jgi:hypothetical protein
VEVAVNLVLLLTATLLIHLAHSRTNKWALILLSIVPNGFNKTFATGAHFYAQRHHPQCIQVWLQGKPMNLKAQEIQLMDGLYLENVHANWMANIFYALRNVVCKTYIFSSALLNFNEVTHDQKRACWKSRQNHSKMAKFRFIHKVNNVQLYGTTTCRI